MHARNRTWLLGSDPVERCRQRTLPVEGGDGSTLSLDFTTGVLDPRLTFTRSTNATFINSQGLVEWAQANLMTQSNAFTTSPWASTNVSMTTDGESPVGSAWRMTENSALASVHRLDPSVVTCSNGVISISVYVKQGSGTRQAYFLVSDNATGEVRSKRLNPVDGSLQGTESTGGSWASASTSVVNVGDGWYRLVLTVTKGGGSGVIVRMGMSDSGGNLGYNGDGTSYLLFSGVQINPGSVQVYAATSGSIYQAPRFDYDPTTLQPRGLLIEGSASNVLQYSEAVDQSPWFTAGTVARATFTGGNGPNGVNNSGSKLSATSISSASSLYYNGLALTAQTYTMSVFAKADGANWIWVSIQQGATIHGAFFDLSGNGALGNTTGTVVSGSNIITKYPNGWFRIQFSFTGTASVWFPVLLPCTSNGTGYASIAGQAPNGVLVYGCQIETGSGASSYIPTGASTGSRAVDVCTMSNITALNYNANGGTLFAHFSNNTENANFAGSIGFNNGANYAQRFLWGSGALLGFYVRTNGTTTLGSYLNGSRTSFASAKAATSYSFDGTTTSTAMSINGAQATTTPTSSAVSGVSIATAFALNSDNSSAATAYPSLAVRSVKFYPTALTMAQMNAITANP